MWAEWSKENLVMTNQQIAYWQEKELERSNRAKELENKRSNMAKEQLQSELNAMTQQRYKVQNFKDYASAGSTVIDTLDKLMDTGTKAGKLVDAFGGLS